MCSHFFFWERRRYFHECLLIITFKMPETTLFTPSFAMKVWPGRHHVIDHMAEIGTVCHQGGGSHQITRRCHGNSSTKAFRTHGAAEWSYITDKSLSWRDGGFTTPCATCLHIASPKKAQDDTMLISNDWYYNIHKNTLDFKVSGQGLHLCVCKTLVL